MTPILVLSTSPIVALIYILYLIENIILLLDYLILSYLMLIAPTET